MGKNTKREILKELEVGYGEIPNLCEGKTWPFDAGKRYKEIQGYSTEESIYDSVRFERSIKWTIRVGLTDKGQYRVRVPELEIDLPKRTSKRNQSTVERSCITKEDADGRKGLHGSLARKIKRA